MKKGCGSVFQMSLFFKMLTQKEQTCESRVKCGDWKNVEIKMLEADMTVRLTGTIQLSLCLLFHLSQSN